MVNQHRYHVLSIHVSKKVGWQIQEIQFLVGLGEMTASGLLYFGDRNPKWMRWSRKGATSLLGASKEIQEFMSIFNVEDAVISVGHGIDIGKGAFGVDF